MKDIFPQNAVDLNMFHNKGLFYKYFRRKEERLYKISDFIGCMSQANVDFILKHNPNIDPLKVEICPNGIEILSIENDKSRLKEIIKKHNIPTDKTKFIYGGNIGKPQGIDFLIQCLKSNKNNDCVFFIIAGSGTEFKKLHHYFEREKPINAKLIEELPREEYELLVDCCDVGLIFLDHRFTIPNFPSRLLSYMKASMPVLAATDIHTDIGRVIEQGEFGLWCESKNVEQFNEKLKQLENPELRDKMGGNARLYLENYYTAKHSYEIITSHFK